jgi:hypothetical protein
MNKRRAFEVARSKFLPAIFFEVNYLQTNGAGSEDKINFLNCCPEKITIQGFFPVA